MIIHKFNTRMLGPNGLTGQVSVAMPEGAKIFACGLQFGYPVIWALVDTDQPKVERRFAVEATGRDLDYLGPVKPIGTVQLANGEVYHVLEQMPVVRFPRDGVVLHKRFADCVAACDGRCSKAWGLNGRPRIKLSDHDDDYVYIPDQYLGIAPGPGKTVGIAEGSHCKPSDVDHADSTKLNKWCARECERSAVKWSVLERDGTLVDNGEGTFQLPDLDNPKPNMSRRVR
jgi:hypothetical protein